MAETVIPSHAGSTAPIGSILRFGALLCILAVSIVAATAFGSVSIPFGETAQIILYKLGLYRGHAGWSDADQSIIWSLRLPRVFAAALVGAALGLAGTLFQAVLRNPLADPYVIGTAAGAQLGVVVALTLPVQIALFGFGTVQMFAFAGALATVFFVYFLARTRGHTPVVTLLLAGFVLSSFLISATTLVLQVSGRVNEILSWTLGSIAVSDMQQVAVTAPFVLGSGVVAYLLAGQLDVILLGEEQAGHLGVRVELLKIIAIVLASFLTALAVSMAGIVAFVGLIVPHTARLIYGPGHRFLLPTAAIGGAIFVIVADLIARVAIPPTPLPLGVVTAVVGAPFFLHLLRRSRRDYGV